MEVQERAPRKTGTNGQDPAPDSHLDQRKLLRALHAVRDGDFSVRLASDQTGLAGKIADTFNEIVTSTERLARELERAGHCRQGRQDPPSDVHRPALRRLGCPRSTL